MTDKLVTHDDLDTLRHIRAYTINSLGERGELLDRLIAAAEADQPPLPEGWVLATFSDSGRQALYHRDGGFFIRDDETLPIPLTAEERDRLTPLRPTITAEDVERATAAVRKHQGTVTYEVLANLVVDALGIEVTP